MKGPVSVTGAVGQSVDGWRRSANLPLALLLLALSTLFLFGDDRGLFYRPGHHDWNSAKYLALAENLSPKHNFALFHSLKPDHDGNSETNFFYHRFPIGGFALIKLAVLPFGDDLSAKILAGRTLMLAFFSAAAVLAYLALSRITGSRWIACAATGLAFSSHFCLYYSDMICTETAVDLFAVMLVFHALTIFVQEGRFRQLLAKTCIALLLGWHVYALLLPFIIFSLAGEMLRAHTQFPHAAPLERMRRLAGLLLRSRSIALGTVALAFGSLVLLPGFVIEWFAAGGTTPIAELPSFHSMMRRMGLEQDASFYDDWAHNLAWPIFLERQFQILGGATLPYSLPGYASFLQLGKHPYSEVMFEDLFSIGVAALAACLVGLCFTRKRILLAPLALFGFFWILPMRNSTAFHDFESLFYVGVPLTLFSLVLLYLRRLSGEPLMARLAVAALLAFVFSTYQMSLVGRDVEERNVQAEIIADFQAIRSLTSAGVIGVMTTESYPHEPGGVPNALRYYLTSRVFIPEPYPLEFAMNQEKLQAIDFLVTDWREPSVATLTPQNRRFFLYDKAAYVGPYDSLFGNLLAQYNFDVYRKGNAQYNFDVYRKGNVLTYFKSPCTEADTAARFLLHVFPTNLADLPEDRRRHGFDNLDFTFSQRGGHFAVGAAPACTARVILPAYGMERIRTGQFDQQGQIWQANFPLQQPQPAPPKAA